MKRCDALINLGMVLLLWCSLAFSCNNGKGGSNGGGATPTRTATQGGAPTEQDVKDAITQHFEDGMGNQYTNLVITYDSPIRIGSATKFNDPQIGWIDVYPTTVNYTVEDEDGFAFYKTHYTGGTLNIYRNTLRNGSWAIGRTMGEKMSHVEQRVKG